MGIPEIALASAILCCSPPESVCGYFFWKPSISLSVAQKPKMNEIGLGAGYTQIYRDGINNNLLSLDLQFNNRTDSEARAILHFLEHIFPKHCNILHFLQHIVKFYKHLQHFTNTCKTIQSFTFVLPRV